jgi:hypothetical protein
MLKGLPYLRYIVNHISFTLYHFQFPHFTVDYMFIIYDPFESVKSKFNCLYFINIWVTLLINEI